MKKNKKNRDLMNWLSSVLPITYSFELNINGVHCVSPEGIEDEKKWIEFKKKLKRQINTHLSEIFHQVNHNHREFTIFTTYKL